MSKLDLSDVRTAINDVINAQPDSSKTPWILLTHVGQTPKVKVVERGDDFSEFMDELSDGKLMYGYIKINLNGIMKGCYISWVPEGIDGVMKGKSTMWSKDMEFELKGKYHTQVSARNENDIDLEEIKKKLKVATGSSYALSSNVKNLSVNQAKDNIAKQQTDHLKGTGVQRVDSSYNSDALKQKSTDFWSKQHKEDEERKKQQESNSRNKTLPTPDLKQKSSEFWAQQQEEKKEQPTRTAPTADLSAKREQFWSQQQKEEEKKDMSSRPVTSVKGDVSSLRSKFMQAQVSEEQKSYAPPPRQTVQSKFQREPEPEPEPEPVRPPVFKKQEEEVPSYHQEPEQHQEEQQDEFNDDSQYQQEQQYYREPEPEPQPNPVDEDEWGEEEKEEPPASSFLPPPPTRASQQSDEPDYPKYKAAYDFEASDPEELSFSEGDVLYVIKSDDDWWTAAHISDPSRTGFVPGNYLEAL